MMKPGDCKHGWEDADGAPVRCPNCLESDIERLQNIVEKLPHFADGVIAENGDQGWHPTEESAGTFHANSRMVCNTEWGADVSECYSTKEAADAAGEKP